MIDLWPEDLGPTSAEAPAVLLNEQAACLEQRTNKVIVVRIEPSYLPRGAVMAKYGTDEDLFMHDFYLVVPLLDNYHYNLFTIFHGLEFYPVIINADDAIKKELTGNILNFTADNQAEFLDLLKRIFSSGRALSIINSILAQVKGVAPLASL
jgi:hypothetical protein